VRRIRIDRINLHVRGVTPSTVQSAARLLGPAVARALAGRTVATEPDASVDAGRVVVGAAPHPEPLAAHIADSIVRSTTSRLDGPEGLQPSQASVPQAGSPRRRRGKEALRPSEAEPQPPQMRGGPRRSLAKE